MDYWHKQTPDKPLFPDLLWSRPENRQHAGKLLIIGGNLHGLSAPALAYQEAAQAGIGVAKVLLPSALQKTVGRLLDNGEFAPSTPSGSFARQALADWLEWGRWADGVLLAGDMGRNSETAVVLERFITDYSGPLAITHDCLDQVQTHPAKLFERPQTLIVGALGQLQKAWPRVLPDLPPLTFSLGIPQTVELLHTATERLPAHLITKHHDQLVVASGGQVSTMPQPAPIWRVATAARATTWLIQNPQKAFEALTISSVASSEK